MTLQHLETDCGRVFRDLKHLRKLSNLQQFAKMRHSGKESLLECATKSSTTTQNLISCAVICRGKNRYVEELHLKGPGHNPTSSELLLERSVAKESEPCSTEIEQSSIEETYAKQFEIQTNSIYYSKEFILIEERSGMTFVSTNISKETLFKPISQNWS